MSQPRSTRTVLADHLKHRADGDLEGDLRRNIDRRIVILTSTGVYRGHSGVRDQAEALSHYAQSDDYHYGDLVVEGELGYLEWTTHGDGVEIRDGADSYLVRDGKIVAQTIHYIARDEGGRRLSKR